jgi:hypothetical protein
MFDEPDKREITPDLADIERRMTRLTPAAPRIDRDRLMFEAGIASVTRPERPGYIAEPFRLGRYFWPAATSTMTAASLLLATMLVGTRHALQLAQNRQPTVVPVQSASQPPDAVPSPTRPEPASARWLVTRTPQNGYLGTRFVALTRGVGAIDTPLESANNNFTPASQPPTRREMLNELLPSTRAMNPKS